MPNENITVYAKFIIAKYTVRYMDGETELGKFSNVEFESAIPTIPADPTKDGYTFAGWDPEIPAAMPAHDVDLQAKWTINKYTVTFVDEDGQTVLKAATEYDYGTAAADIEKPADPTKAATQQYTYTFAGWTPSVAEVTDDATYTATYTSTVNQYEVIFVDEDGTELKEATAYDYGTAAADIVKPADPEKEGYTFAGWDPADVEVTDDVTNTATYTINQYTITFDTDGGTTIAPITQDYNTAVTAPADPEKEGYTFAGWDAEIPATMPAENITITAQWTINQYTITFVLGNGDENVEITQNYGTEITAPDDLTRIYICWLGCRSS